MERVIRPAWQVVCHGNELPSPGDWRTIDYLGESVIVVRGDDGAVRAFANVCRHRGSRVVSGGAGCARRLTCPYHAWTYALDGRLIGVPHKSDYPGLDPSRLGLVPVELEAWHGFLFVRLETGGPSGRRDDGAVRAEIAPYRLEALRPLGRVTLRPRPVNWKNVADNYSDGLHIAVAHPGLTRLFGRGYRIDGRGPCRPHVGRPDRPALLQPLRARLSGGSCPAPEHLPPELRRRWLYFKLWPNVAFDLYPDQVDFMQFLPVSPTETLIREISYALPDDRSRKWRAR
jgi:phenylpropionate dioxygenase-like ring-hydroxylating dioxygenase large terminal subunit